ncbi:MAG TPA: sensor domain-containing diguanylate cyclase [Planctomycetaceae bacterium]
MLSSTVFDVAGMGVSSGCVVALTVICLLQYVMHVNRMALAGRLLQATLEQRDQIAGELDQISSELAELKRDRNAFRFESQVLRDFVAQPDCDKAMRAFLRRFIPNPDEGFALFLHHDQGRLAVAQSHGLFDAAAAILDLDGGLLSRLSKGEAVSLNRQEVRDSRIWDSISPRDRSKLDQLHLFGIAPRGSGSPDGGSADSGPFADLLGVLLTTRLAPVGLEPADQTELIRRLLETIHCGLRDKQMLELQQDQLQSTGEMLALRNVIDRKYDSPAQMLEEFVRQAAEKSAADRASLFLCTSDSATPVKAFVRCGETLQAGLKEQWQRHEDDLAYACLAIRGVRAYSRGELERLGITTLLGSALVVPVLQQNRPLGLVLFTRRAREEFTRNQQALAVWTGNLLADLIPRVVNQAVVERQARLDGLTQVANRGEFDRQIHHELQIATRSGTPLSLLMFDLDRFKSINDTYGHQAGDTVLRAAARLIRDCVRGIRTADRAAGVRPFVARYGGEELAVLARLDRDAAARIGEFIRTRLEMQSFDFEGRQIRVTTSVGLASFPEHAESCAELIAAADAALYQAKLNGRNRLETAPPALVEAKPALVRA